MQPKEHWERVYATRPANAVSWYQEHAEHSLRLIHATGLPRSASIIDVGGGASTLVDDLLQEGYSALTVLDISAAALEAARARLGNAAQAVHWIAANLTEFAFVPHTFDLWHDRAVFHFLTSQRERTAYVDAVLRAVKPDGHVIVATFAEDGPLQCSGLPVMRYTPGALHAEFGDAFTLLEHQREEHHTPSGVVQKFIYCYCRKTAQ
jgi:ubiquinone/menaquinone biosynthesis C-methylase UbiE